MNAVDVLDLVETFAQSRGISRAHAKLQLSSILEVPLSEQTISDTDTLSTRPFRRYRARTDDTDDPTTTTDD